MLVALLATIFAGFPIAFTLIVLGIIFGYAGFGDTVFHLMVFQFFATMKEQTLAQVPLFVFMGLLLERAGLMERLFYVTELALARVNGSLYLSAMFCRHPVRRSERHRRRLGDAARHHGRARPWIARSTTSGCRPGSSPPAGRSASSSRRA